MNVIRKHFRPIAWLFFPLGTALFSGGCSERIDVKLGSADPRLVVDARFTTDTTTHIVKLSRTCDYYDPNVDSMAVSGASVYIVDAGSNRIDFTEDGRRPGYYVTDPDVFGMMGGSYCLYITADIDGDGESELYEAQSEMPYMPPIDSVKAVYGMGLPPFFIPDPDELGWNLLLYAQDPPTKEYYAFSYSVNGKTYEDSVTNLFRFPDNFTSGAYLYGVPLYFFPEDSANKRKVVLQEGDTLTLFAYSFTEGYDRYLADINEAVASNIPIFSATPSNVRGNVSNGAFGYFAVYSMGKGTCIVGRKPLKPVPDI